MPRIMRIISCCIAGAILLPSALLAQSIVPTRYDDIGVAGPEAARSASPGTWWKWNRAEFVAERIWTPIAEEDARAAIDVISAHLSSEHVEVRSAACRALGRAGRRFEDLTLSASFARCLTDKNAELRFDAIHALGLSAQPEAVSTLVAIMDGEASGGTARRSADPRSAAAAVLALALARNANNATAIDAEVQRLTEQRHIDAELELAQALFLNFVRLDLRRSETTRPDFEALLASSKSSDLQVRRATAIQLGELADERAAQLLRTWFSSEREHLTQAFALIALGRCSDAETRSFLMRTWRSTTTSLQPWCALSLALYARRFEDREIRTALRCAAQSERNQISARATLLACGIAGDLEALPLAMHVLATSKNTGSRVAAARTLAMLGDERACASLSRALKEETCPTTRAIVADALGTFARPSDAPVLVEYLLRYPELAHRRTIARAIARLGPPALAQLLKELKREDLPAIGRASLLDALGWCVAGDQQPHALASLLQAANYMSMPTWMVSALTRIE